MTITLPTPIIRCSKCKSVNVVEPANKAGFIYRCEDCGHKKIKEPPTEMIDMQEECNASSWEPPKEIEF